MNVADLDLPSDLIAQEPPATRGASRLLVLDRRDGALRHAAFTDLPGLLSPSDLLVVNDTRVFPARLLGRRDPWGGAVECLLLGRAQAQDGAEPGEVWDALVHPGHKLRVGERIVFAGDGGALHGQILGRHFFGRRTIRFWTDDGRPVDEVIDRVGHVPLPPYIKRPDRAEDRERYQTVYARARGSVAAPTAGLHFTPLLLEALADRGIERIAITLHVGYGTFKPVRTDVVEEHRVDPEPYAISEAAADRLNAARAAGRRIVAVGTTTVRALESAVRTGGGRVRPGAGTAELFIHPGVPFEIVGGLVTNFHLPRSSLLMLVCAFAGRERVLDAYRQAIAQGYRFYSYGDAMLIL